jgi:hypothetical protein
MKQNFKGLFKKIRRPPEHLKTLRSHMAFKVLLGIPFLKKQEVVFILDIPAKVTASAAIIRSYGNGQGSDRLRQFLVLLRKNLHSDDGQDHDQCIAKSLPTNWKRQGFEIDVD